MSDKHAAMKSDEVRGLCVRLRRERREFVRVPDKAWLGRCVFLAVARDVQHRPGYDPLMDRRVEWLVEMAKGCQEGGGGRWPVVESHEALVGSLVGEVVPGCGKDAAAESLKVEGLKV